MPLVRAWEIFIARLEPQNACSSTFIKFVLMLIPFWCIVFIVVESGCHLRPLSTHAFDPGKAGNVSDRIVRHHQNYDVQVTSEVKPASRYVFCFLLSHS